MAYAVFSWYNSLMFIRFVRLYQKPLDRFSLRFWAYEKKSALRVDTENLPMYVVKKHLTFTLLENCVSCIVFL